MITSQISSATFGYRSETAAITAALSDFSGALIVGPSGIGKTTLLNSVVGALDSDTPVLRFRGSAELMDRSLGVFEVFLSRAGLSADLAPGAALSTIAREITSRSQGNLPIVVVDNAARVDEHSLSVLAQLVAAGRIRLLAAAETIRPPVDLLANLWMSGLLRRIDLTGLDRRAVETMVRNIDPSVRSQAVAELHAKSQGNPQMLRNLLVGRVQVRAADRVLWSVDPRHRSLLEMIAIVGALPHEVLAHFADLRDIDELVERRIIRMTEGRRAAVSLVEPVVEEALRTGVRPSRSLQLWKELTAVLDIDTVEGQVLFGMVAWAQSLGFQLSAERVFAAGSWANSAWRYAEAAEVLRGSQYEDPTILLELARSERGLGHFAEAKMITDRLVDAATGATPRTAADEAELSRLACIELRLTDPRRPEDLNAVWVRDRLSSPAERGRLDVTRARFELKGGRLAAGRALAEGVYHDHSCATRHRTRACALLGATEVMCGRIKVGLDYLAQAELMFQLPGMTSFELEDAGPQFFLGRYIAGEWEDARRSLQWMTVSPQLAEISSALIDIRSGNVARAHTVLERQRHDSRMLEMVDPSRLARGAMQLAEGILGTDPAPIDVPSAPAPIGTEGGFAAYTWWAEMETRLIEFQALALTNRDRAAHQLYELGHSAEEAGARTVAVMAWIDAVRYGHHRAVEALGAMAETVDGGPGRFGRAIAAAFERDDHTTLTEAAREALAFGAVVVCSDLARSARTKAIARGDSSGVREARILMETSLRTMRFNTPGARLPDVLTELEKKVVDGVMDGASSADLGARLHLSPRTIEWHLSRIYRRLHVSSRQELREIVRTWER
ncbi:regulatory LuxR family protein [Brevibacterium sanguinis]|uniref:Regulatory LuxR family protein n=2 Tax=Brevibacterium TaxID=1696 RepID=A0A366ILB8_9MICO|nr:MULTISPECIES: LuxR C-terminal-related transcriptional regulator [Brevibacterium]RBP66981.1 regulatory LuxR family protein [Brevibacterium sanguinis]RBP73506.1 regulatory LuxR family protein [Brevibacterium celere]